MNTTQCSPPQGVESCLSRRKTQAGATLIEVLVAVVLLSFGVVGLAGLQFNGTKFNHSSYLRSQAVSLAYDLSDRVRANLDACQSGGTCAYETPLATGFAGGAACGEALVAAADANALAATDVNQWKSCLENALPGGQGLAQVLPSGTAFVDQCSTTHAATARDIFVVEVNWSDGRLQGGANPRDCVVVRTEVRPL